MTDALPLARPDADAEKRPRASLFTATLVAIPLVAFGGIAVLCWQRLHADSSAIPSALIGRAPPPFDLPVVDLKARGDGTTKARFTNADLKGKVTIVNFFASYCEPCRQENPQLMQLAEDKALAAKGVRIAGIAWKDKVAGATRQFLDTDGNPFAIVGADVGGWTGIDWGITGVPETYVIKRDGTIAFKYVGQLTDHVVADILMPQVEKVTR